MRYVGETVSVRGKQYRITAIKNCSSSGPKFFGKFVFSVVDHEGNKFDAFGKNITGNSKLTPR